MNFESLYVHFPFCENKCCYCDFYSLGRSQTRPEAPQQFEQALKLEAEHFAPQLAPQLQTLFFGGGTPSLTQSDSMLRALEPLSLRQRLGPETEWTLEANPASVSISELKAYSSLGVNRISLGVQTMNPSLLKRLGRVHSASQVVSTLEKIFSAGLTRVSIDLLCGVPDQSLEDLKEACSLLDQFPIHHCSVYLLTLKKSHFMAAQLPEEAIQVEHLMWIHDWMSQRGFEHYEISNFAKPGQRARHNMDCWKGLSYLGLGPSAHSYDAVQKKRWKNVASLPTYVHQLQAGKLPILEEEVLNEEQLDLEKWLLALRLSDGFPIQWLGVRQQSFLQAWQEQGWIEVHPEHSDYLRLTTLGFTVSDSIMMHLTSSY